MHAVFVVGPRMTLGAPASPLSPSAMACLVAPSATAAAAPGGIAGSVVIPDSLYRKVYSYDGVARTFRLSADSGGPAAGVRFLLHDVDNYSGLVMPLNLVGWLDLANLGTAVSDTIRASVHNNSATMADLLIVSAGTRDAYHATLTGLIQVDGSVVAVRDSIAAAGADLTLSAVLDDSARGARLSFVATRTTYDPADNLYQLDLRFSRGGHTVRLRGAIDTYCWFGISEFAITVDDVAVGTYRADEAARSVTLVSGAVASAEDRRAILGLVDAQLLLFGWSQALFAPMWRLLPP